MAARRAPTNPLAVLSIPYFINTIACKIREFISGIPSSGRFVSSTYIFYSIRKSHGGFRALVGGHRRSVNLRWRGSLCACLMLFDGERKGTRMREAED